MQLSRRRTLDPRRSIKAKLVLGTTGIILAVVCVLAFVIAQTAAELLRRESVSQLRQFLDQGHESLDNFMQVREATLDLWAANPLPNAVVSDPALGAVFVPSLRQYVARYREREPWIENIVLIKDDAVLYDDTGELGFGASGDDIGDGLLNLLTLPVGKPVVLNLSALNPALDLVVIALKRRVFEDGEAVPGAFMVLFLDLAVIESSLFSGVGIGSQGFLSLAAEITLPRDGGLWLSRRAPDSPERRDFRQALDGGLIPVNEPFEYRSVILNRRALGASRIEVIGAASLNDVRQPVTRLVLTAVVVGILASLLGIAGVVLFSEKLTAPVRALTASARRLAAGQLDEAPQGARADSSGAPERAARARQDEVGELSAAFDQMAGDIGSLIAELRNHNEMSSAAISTRDLDAVLDLVAKIVARSGSYDRVRLYLVDESRNELICRAAVGMAPGEIDRLRLSLSDTATGVSQHVFKTRAPYLVEDVATDPLCSPELSKLLRARSYAVVPLVAGEKALGVLAVDYAATQADFPRERLDSLEAFGNTAALAIDNSLLYEDLERYSRDLELKVDERTAELAGRVAQLDTLNRITLTVTARGDLDSQLHAVAREMVELLNMRDAGIALLDKERTHLSVVSFYSGDPDRASTVGTVIPLAGNPTTERALATGKPVLVNDVLNNAETASMREVSAKFGIESLLIVPLVSKGESIGTIGLTSGRPDFTLPAAELNLAETVAHNVVGTIDRARLFDGEQSQRRIAESLRDVAADLNASLDLDTILPKILEQMKRVVDYDSGAVFLRKGDALEIVSGDSIGDDFIGYRVPLDSELPEARAFRSMRPEILSDVREDPTWIQWTPENPICAWLGVPMIAGGKAIGLLTTDSFHPGAFTRAEASVVQAFSDHATSAIQNARLFAAAEAAKREAERANREITVLNERLKAENLRMSAELDVTRRLQRMVLPTQGELNAVGQLDIAGFMEPADEVGGDYFDVLQRNGLTKISIGDVTGHGLESGVVMLMAQTAVRTLLTAGEDDPVRFLDTLNRTLYDNVQRMGTDKSLSLSILDYAHGQLRLSGQHEELIVVRRDGEVERVDTMELGFPIALDEEIASFVGEHRLALADGDGVVMYTDGITEAENAAGEMYGIERLCRVVSASWTGRAEEIKNAVIDDVRRHIDTQQVYDDITLLVVKKSQMDRAHAG